MTNLSPVAGFTVLRVLSEDSFGKIKCILGKLGDDQAVLIIRRRHVDEDTVASLVAPSTNGCQLVFDNDIYKQFLWSSPTEVPDVMFDLICPATDKHIQKYSEQRRFMVKETPELFTSVVQPYISAIPASRIDWVHNLLEKKKEALRLIFEDPDPHTGFMLHPDMKWDGGDVEQLYCIAICHSRDVPSLRSLDAARLLLLKNIRDKALQAIEARYGVKSDQLRVFVHYPPSYYHFHVHFANLKYQAAGVVAGKAFLLDDIIENIENVSGAFYQQRTLHYTIGEEEELGQLIRKQQQQQQ